jgi:hypothetical protein
VEVKLTNAVMPDSAADGRGEVTFRFVAEPAPDEMWLHFFYTPADAEAGLVATRIFEFDGRLVTFRCKESAAKVLSKSLLRNVDRANKAHSAWEEKARPARRAEDGKRREAKEERDARLLKRSEGWLGG